MTHDFRRGGAREIAHLKCQPKGLATEAAAHSDRGQRNSNRARELLNIAVIARLSAPGKRISVNPSSLTRDYRRARLRHYDDYSAVTEEDLRNADLAVASGGIGFGRGHKPSGRAHTIVFSMRETPRPTPVREWAAINKLRRPERLAIEGSSASVEKMSTKQPRSRRRKAQQEEEEPPPSPERMDIEEEQSSALSSPPPDPEAVLSSQCQRGLFNGGSRLTAHPTVSLGHPLEGSTG